MTKSKMPLLVGEEQGGERAAPPRTAGLHDA